MMSHTVTMCDSGAARDGTCGRHLAMIGCYKRRDLGEPAPSLIQPIRYAVYLPCVLCEI